MLGTCCLTRMGIGEHSHRFTNDLNTYPKQNLTATFCDAVNCVTIL